MLANQLSGMGNTYIHTINVAALVRTRGRASCRQVVASAPCSDSVRGGHRSRSGGNAPLLACIIVARQEGR